MWRLILECLGTLLPNTEPKPSKWKYIGFDRIMLRREARGRKVDFEVQILFFMTDDGQRMFEIADTEPDVIRWIKENSTEYRQAYAWQMGGSFPKDFKPEHDTLGEMLSRIMDAKLTGEANG